MKVLVSIDDTDNIKSRGTGKLAALLAQLMEEKGWGKAQAITRHQLFVHEDIPYTSHNSSMCFVADIEPAYLNKYIDFTGEFLERESAPGSDPGLCIVVPECLSHPEKLLSFGYRAKKPFLKNKKLTSLPNG